MSAYDEIWQDPSIGAPVRPEIRPDSENPNLISTTPIADPTTLVEHVANAMTPHMTNLVFDTLAAAWTERSQRWFPQCWDTEQHAIMHHAIGLAGEVGEVCNLIKKQDRDGYDLDRNVKIRTEIVDSLCYLLMLGDRFGVDWADEIKDMNDRNTKRWG